jgi:hypothetical protein
LKALVQAVAPDVLIGVEAPSQKRRDLGESAQDYAARVMASLRMLGL